MNGRGAVWICEDFYKDAQFMTAGCGFIGMYKPETDKKKRYCPSCDKAVTYHYTGDVALVAVEAGTIHSPMEEGEA